MWPVNSVMNNRGMWMSSQTNRGYSSVVVNPMTPLLPNPNNNSCPSLPMFQQVNCFSFPNLTQSFNKNNFVSNNAYPLISNTSYNPQNTASSVPIFHNNNGQNPIFHGQQQQIVSQISTSPTKNVLTNNQSFANGFPPLPPGLANLIDTTAKTFAMYPQSPDTIKSLYGNNPKYSFLFGGEGYYFFNNILNYYTNLYRQQTSLGVNNNAQMIDITANLSKNSPSVDSISNNRIPGTLNDKIGKEFSGERDYDIDSLLLQYREPPPPPPIENDLLEQLYGFLSEPYKEESTDKTLDNFNKWIQGNDFISENKSRIAFCIKNYFCEKDRSYAHQLNMLSFLKKLTITAGSRDGDQNASIISSLKPYLVWMLIDIYKVLDNVNSSVTIEDINKEVISALEFFVQNGIIDDDEKEEMLALVMINNRSKVCNKIEGDDRHHQCMDESSKRTAFYSLGSYPESDNNGSYGSNINFCDGMSIIDETKASESLASGHINNPNGYAPNNENFMVIDPKIPSINDQNKVSNPVNECGGIAQGAISHEENSSSVTESSTIGNGIPGSTSENPCGGIPQVRKRNRFDQKPPSATRSNTFISINPPNPFINVAAVNNYVNCQTAISGVQPMTQSMMTSTISSSIQQQTMQHIARRLRPTQFLLNVPQQQQSYNTILPSTTYNGNVNVGMMIGRGNATAVGNAATRGSMPFANPLSPPATRSKKELLTPETVPVGLMATLLKALSKRGKNMQIAFVPYKPLDPLLTPQHLPPMEPPSEYLLDRVNDFYDDWKDEQEREERRIQRKKEDKMRAAKKRAEKTRKSEKDDNSKDDSARGRNSCHSSHDGKRSGDRNRDHRSKSRNKSLSKSSSHSRSVSLSYSRSNSDRGSSRGASRSPSGSPRYKRNRSRGHDRNSSGSLTESSRSRRGREIMPNFTVRDKPINRINEEMGVNDDGTAIASNTLGITGERLGLGAAVSLSSEDVFEKYRRQRANKYHEHIAHNQASRRDPGSDSKLTCFICQQPGHFARECKYGMP